MNTFLSPIPFFLVTACLGAQSPRDGSHELKTFVQEAFDAEDLHGVVLVTTAVPGTGVFELRSASGQEDASGDRPIHPDSRFQIASLTKALTQAAVLRLVDAGRLDLDQSYAHYRPDSALAEAGAITLRHLLAMQSGLPRELSGSMEESGVRFDAAGMAGPFLDSVDVALQFAPGEGRAYSNVGYWLLGAVLEAVTEKPYAEAMEELVFAPLGMGASGLASGDGSDRAQGLAGAEDDRQVVEPALLARRYASGGLFSTAPDLLRFWRGVGGDDFLTAEAQAQLFSRFAEDPPAGFRRRSMIAGMLPGFRCMMVCDRDQDLVLILLNNLDITPPDRLMRRLQGIEQRALRMRG